MKLKEEYYIDNENWINNILACDWFFPVCDWFF